MFIYRPNKKSIGLVQTQHLNCQGNGLFIMSKALYVTLLTNLILQTLQAKNTHSQKNQRREHEGKKYEFEKQLCLIINGKQTEEKNPLDNKEK